jgi:hypothetical protein
MVVNTPDPSASLDGVVGIAVGPELTLDCRCCRPDPFSIVLMPGGGFEPCVDGAVPAAARPRSDRWHDSELSACCATAASSSALSCWHTCLSLEVAASRQPRSKMAAAAKFCDARLKSSGASPLALASTFTPLLARRSLSWVRPQAGGVGRGLGTARQQDDTPATHRSPHGVAPTPGPPVGPVAARAACCGVHGPPRAPGGGWTTPR